MLLLGGSATSTVHTLEPNNPDMAEYKSFLVQGDFRSHHLSPAELKDLEGMYYAKDPKSQIAELRELASANTKVHSLLRQIKGIVID
jgi:hypothetical protein